MPDITSRSTYFTSQYSKNKLIRDLLEGLDALRSTNQDSDQHTSSTAVKESYYLPKNPEEPDHIYKNRLYRSYLVNFFKRAIETDSGKILSSPVNVSIDGLETLPDDVKRWLDDTDLEGKPFDVLASDQLQDGLAKGLSLVYVDFLSEEQRPFAKEIDIDHVLAFKTNPRTGKLNYLRWASSIVQDSEDEINVEENNVTFEVTPTKWSIYEDGEDDPMDTGEIVRYRNATEIITDEIPVSLFYTNKKGQMLAESPYRDLAELTIEHFQQNSDIKNNLYFALTPFLFGKGIPEEAAINALAAWQFVESGEGYEHADIKWVQASAAPIEQARKTVEDIERRISLFGVDLSGIRPSGNATATQSAINSAGANAALETFAKGLSEHLERIVELGSSYTLSPLQASVTVTPDFSVDNNSDNVKNALSAYKERLISGKATTDVMKQNNALPKDYSFEVDQELRMQESAGMGSDVI